MQMCKLLNNSVFYNNFNLESSHHLQFNMNLSCTKDDDSTSRGRILAYCINAYCKIIMSLITSSNLHNKRNSACNHKRRYARKKSQSKMINMFQTTLLHHLYFCNKATHPFMLLNAIPLVTLLETTRIYKFYKTQNYSQSNCEK